MNKLSVFFLFEFFKIQEKLVKLVFKAFKSLIYNSYFLTNTSSIIPYSLASCAIIQ